ncbi:transcription initiation factor tfiid subunit [Anaeramoeba flamelloides]|uniref:Transcription initiation factor tfiid subunit n=1 Tax=Anaeramoeba flamelloides TaxID=1746091 RepID=A0AAV7ZBX0_9EUKA|nr:transcription initiation factor tfiid subunit [Anaeramoeba flamelloides]
MCDYLQIDTSGVEENQKTEKFIGSKPIYLEKGNLKDLYKISDHLAIAINKSNETSLYQVVGNRMEYFGKLIFKAGEKIKVCSLSCAQDSLIAISKSTKELFFCKLNQITDLFQTQKEIEKKQEEEPEIKKENEIEKEKEKEKEKEQPQENEQDQQKEQKNEIEIEKEKEKEKEKEQPQENQQEQQKEKKEEKISVKKFDQKDLMVCKIAELKDAKNLKTMISVNNYHLILDNSNTLWIVQNKVNGEYTISESVYKVKNIFKNEFSQNKEEQVLIQQKTVLKTFKIVDNNGKKEIEINQTKVYQLHEKPKIKKVIKTAKNMLVLFSNGSVFYSSKCDQNQDTVFLNIVNIPKMNSLLWNKDYYIFFSRIGFIYFVKDLEQFNGTNKTPYFARIIPKRILPNLINSRIIIVPKKQDLKEQEKEEIRNKKKDSSSDSDSDSDSYSDSDFDYDSTSDPDSYSDFNSISKNKKYKFIPKGNTFIKHPIEEKSLEMNKNKEYEIIKKNESKINTTKEGAQFIIKYLRTNLSKIEEKEKIRINYQSFFIFFGRISFIAEKDEEFVIVQFNVPDFKTIQESKLIILNIKFDNIDPNFQKGGIFSIYRVFYVEGNEIVIMFINHESKLCMTFITDLASKFRVNYKLYNEDPDLSFLDESYTVITDISLKKVYILRILEPNSNLDKYFGIIDNKWNYHFLPKSIANKHSFSKKIKKLTKKNIKFSACNLHKKYCDLQNFSLYVISDDYKLYSYDFKKGLKLLKASKTHEFFPVKKHKSFSYQMGNSFYVWDKKKVLKIPKEVGVHYQVIDTKLKHFPNMFLQYGVKIISFTQDHKIQVLEQNYERVVNFTTKGSTTEYRIHVSDKRRDEFQNVWRVGDKPIKFVFESETTDGVPVMGPCEDGIQCKAWLKGPNGDTALDTKITEYKGEKQDRQNHLTKIDQINNNYLTILWNTGFTGRILVEFFFNNIRIHWLEYTNYDGLYNLEKLEGHFEYNEIIISEMEINQTYDLKRLGKEHFKFPLMDDKGNYITYPEHQKGKKACLHFKYLGPQKSDESKQDEKEERNDRYNKDENDSPPRSTIKNMFISESEEEYHDSEFEFTDNSSEPELVDPEEEISSKSIFPTKKQADFVNKSIPKDTKYLDRYGFFNFDLDFACYGYYKLLIDFKDKESEYIKNYKRLKQTPVYIHVKEPEKSEVKKQN